jgi:DNA polymerase-3 subunit alpha
VLLAKDNEGYKNLSYLVSMGYMEGFYYNPRIDRELLKKHSKGIIGLSACLGGVVNKCFLREGVAKAAEAAREYAELFEPGNFYLELQSNGYEEQERANQALMEIGKTLGLPMVATADSHYLTPEDSKAHEILMCIGQGRSLDEFRAKMHHSDLLYVRTPQQMWDALGQLCPEAIENTHRIAAQCNVELNLSETFLPSYGVPEGESRESYLAKMTLQGLKRRMAEAYYPIDEPAYKRRLDYELDVILKMGFAGYFLIVWDFIRYAKNTGIPVGPGRGSGAGSLVAWCLRITDLDPIPYDLLFERFLNPERVSMPDFDIDFCQDRRSEVIDYVGNKYGKQNVGQIVTYSQLSAKSVIKDVGRVLQLPFAEVNELTKLIPNLVNGKKVSIDQALQIEPKLVAIQKERPIYGQVIDIARSLEGLGRNTGMHAAGIVIGDRPLWDYVPVCRGKDGELITQFAKDEVEEAGLVKFDFLGLKTLTVIAAAQKHVRARPGNGPLGPHAAFDAERVPLDDAQVYKLIAQADTDGVFQLESSGFKELLKRLRPDRFEDVVAAVALYRPGPLDAGMVDDYIARKHGRKKVNYPHPVCEEILKTTYGVIVYQEQVMRIAVALCGFTMGEADVLRKAMGKKKAEVMAQMREKFVRGATKTSQMDPQEADDLFTQIEKFAGYAFNKSHSAAYAVITYQTAFLKTYYPLEFMAALLSTEMRDQDNVVRYIASAREHGISILPPCVNRSGRDFSVERTGEHPDGAILFGLGAVKGIGDGAIDAIVEGRSQALDKNADALAFGCLFDFCEQVDVKRVNRRVLEALIKSGACDSFGRDRASLFASVERALEGGQRAWRDRAIGQTNLFGALLGQPDGAAHKTDSRYEEASPWSEKERLALEKEALGFYITGHPLDHFKDDLPRLTTANTQTLQNMPKGGFARGQGEVALGGVVAAIRERPLKSGNGRMAFLTLEDHLGSCEVLVFSRAFAEGEAAIKSQEPLLVMGHVMVEGDDDEGGVAKIRATKILSLAEARVSQTKALSLHLPLQNAKPAVLQALRSAMAQHPGEVPVTLHLTDSQFRAKVSTSPTLKVAPTEALMAHLQRLAHPGRVSLS